MARRRVSVIRGLVRKHRSARSTPARFVATRGLVQQHVQALHLPDERVDVVARRRSVRAPAASDAASPAARSACTIASASARASRFGTTSASWPSSRMSSRPSASVATIGLPDRQRFEHGQRRALPQRRKHAQVERGEHLRDVASRSRRTRTDRRGRARAPAPRAARAASPSPTRKNADVGCRRDEAARPRPGTRCLSTACSRVTVPMANRRPARCRALPRGRAISSARARPAELLERRAEIDDLDLLGRHSRAPRHEVRGALRHGERDVGVRLQQPIGDFLEPGRVGEVRVLVQDRRQPPHRPRQPAERRRAVAVQVQDVDLLPVDDLEQRRAASPDRTCDRCR